MRLQLTAELEHPARGDQGFRSDRASVHRSAESTGTGGDKPDRADETKWRDALVNAGPLVSLHPTQQGDLRSHLPDTQQETAAVSQADVAATLADRDPNLGAPKTRATPHFHHIQAAIAPTESPGPTNGRHATQTTNFAAPGKPVPENAPTEFANSEVGNRWGNTVAESNGPELQEAGHSLRAGIVGGADTFSSSGGQDSAAPQRKDTTDDHRIGDSSISLSHHVPKVQITADFRDQGVQQGKAEGCLAGPGDPQAPTTKALPTGLKTALNPVSQTVDKKQKTLPPAIGVDTPKASPDRQIPDPSDRSGPVAAAEVIPYSARDVETPKLQTTRLSGISENLFRLRAQAISTVKPAGSGSVNNSMGQSAPEIVGSAVAGRPAAPIDGAYDGGASEIAPAMADETSSTTRSTEPLKPEKVGQIDALQGFGAVREHAGNQPDGSGPVKPNNLERAGTSELPPALLLEGQSQTAIGQALQSSAPQPVTLAVISSMILEAGTGDPVRHSDIAQQIVRALPGSTEQEVAVVLSPEELGTVRMVMHAKGENLTLQIHADRADTLDLMRRSSEHLLQDLRTSGFTNVSLDFSQNQRRPTPPPLPVAAAQTYAPEQHTNLQPESAAAVRRPAGGSLDLRL